MTPLLEKIDTNFFSIFNNQHQGFVVVASSTILFTISCFNGFSYKESVSIRATINTISNRKGPSVDACEIGLCALVEMWRDSSEASLLHRFTGLFRSGALDDDDGSVKDIERSYRSEDRCSTRRVIKSKCRTEEVEPSKFIRKCEKTEQLLRDCVGRPTELVESKNEYTEEDVSRDAASVLSPLDERHGLAELEPYIPPILRSDIDQFERGLFGGLESFIHAAEQMASDFFHSFRFPEHSGETQSPFGRFKDGNLERGVDGFDYEQKQEGNNPHKIEEPEYADYAKDFKEI